MGKHRPRENGENGLESIPEITLILGTDAAGKDHVANILTRMIAEKGGDVEKRQRFLCGKVTTASSSVGKSYFELLLELMFLALYPYLGLPLLTMLTYLLKRDCLRFKQSPKKLVIVGHNCLRGLAFHWGRKLRKGEEITVPPALSSALAEMSAIPGFHVVVLDVDDEIRQKRIRHRAKHGEADNFDRYMARDSLRSEGIESTLVWLAREYLNGQLIENNDLPEQELRRLLFQGFKKTMSEEPL